MTNIFPLMPLVEMQSHASPKTMTLTTILGEKLCEQIYDIKHALILAI